VAPKTYTFQGSDGRTSDCQDTLGDSALFAQTLFSHLAADGDPRILESVSMPQWQAYSALRDEVQNRITDPDLLKLFGDMDDAAGDLASMSHASGVLFGASAEQMRRSLLSAPEDKRRRWRESPS